MIPYDLGQLRWHSWDLSVGGTHPAQVGDVQIVFASYRGISASTTWARISKQVNGQEYVAWVKDLEQNPVGVIDLNKITKWIPVTYTASFRRSGDLNASEYTRNTRSEAYECIASWDRDKEYRDDSFVFCNDGRPHWWGVFN